MSVLPDSSRDQIIRTALRKKFGWVLDWSPPTLWHKIGPCMPDVYDDFIEVRSTLLNTATEALHQLSDQELMEVGQLAGLKENATLDWWDDFLSVEVRGLRKKIPSDLMFGLGHPDWKADMVYWSQMPNFTLREVVLLSVGVDPERFDDKSLGDIEKNESDRTYPTIRYVLKRLRLLRRYFSFGGAPHERMSLKDFKQLIDDIGLEVPDEWYDALRNRLVISGEARAVGAVEPDAEREDAHALAAERAPEGREVASIAKLLTAIAIEEYGYDPASRRGPIPREIQDITDRLGLSVHQDTIRKYLRIGAKYLPKD